MLPPPAFELLAYAACWGLELVALVYVASSRLPLLAYAASWGLELLVYEALSY
jgi:hypothetical protein